MHKLVTWPSEGLTRVPHSVYADPAIYEQEQIRIFRGPSWNFVGLLAEVLAGFVQRGRF